MTIADVLSRLNPVAPPKDEHKDSRGISFNPRAIRPIVILGWLTVAGLIFAALPPLLLVHPGSYINYQNASIAVLMALAVTGISAVVGFLFGLPRSSSGDGTANAGSAAGGGSSATARASTRPRNASLEQVADWLTKLMLGAGLTQLGEIKAQTLTLAYAIGSAVGPAVSASAAPHAAKIFGLGIIGYFATCGFLGGYLCTRLLLERLLREEEFNLDDMAREAEQKGRELGKQEGRQEGHEEGKLEARDHILREVNRNKLVRDASAVDEAGAIAKAWEPPTPPTVEDDPQKGRFGGKPEQNGRRLSATVSPFGTDKDLFEVALRVEALKDSPPLAQPVKFFLHNSFEPDRTVVLPKNGAAKLDLVAWGAFAVGAITDDGKTLLELDLAELEGAPPQFRSR